MITPSLCSIEPNVRRTVPVAIPPLACAILSAPFLPIKSSLKFFLIKPNGVLSTTFNIKFAGVLINGIICFNIGKSLYEEGFIPSAKAIIKKLESRGASLPIVSDVVCGKKFDENEHAVMKHISEIESDDMIFDLGTVSMDAIVEKIKIAKTILWNGPIGVFEFKQFSKGTELLAHAVANSSAFSLAGGGDTIAAIEAFGMEKNISYVSTAGGAFLEFVEGKKLPAIEILEKRAKK